MADSIKITECPRDAMQGIKEWIPTEDKLAYLSQLMHCGFDTLDAGSFVSPKAIPQMQDTASIISQLPVTNTKLLVIVANERGADEAIQFDAVRYLGYPFSISETFQQRNTNASIEESLKRVEGIANLCSKSNKELVLYLSMGFGNPYGDVWNEDLVASWSDRLIDLFPVSRLSLSDTIGAATPDLVKRVFETVSPVGDAKNVAISAHLHAIREQATAITAAAFDGGCRMFEGAINGFGGCPMAKDDLTGNMPTELMLKWFDENGIQHGVDLEKFEKARVTSATIMH